MADIYPEDISVDEISEALPVVENISGENQQQRQRPQNERRNPDRREAKDHFNELAQAAEVTHRLRDRKGRRCLYCVYREGDEVYVDIVVLDKQGRPASTKRRCITHEPYLKWLERIDEGEGMVLDRLS